MNSRAQSPVTFVVTFTTTMAGIDGIRALKAVLKFALRRFGLKCVDAREIQASPDAALSSPALLTDSAEK
jgi:hypothetical protein